MSSPSLVTIQDTIIKEAKEPGESKRMKSGDVSSPGQGQLTVKSSGEQLSPAPLNPSLGLSQSWLMYSFTAFALK